MDLGELQRLQETHDQKYHRDIYYLPTIRWLTHLTLHYLKYAGKLTELIHGGKIEKGSLETIVIDACIVTLSAANTLNIDLDSKRVKGIAGYQQEEAIALRDSITLYAGQMAKALESLDHMETTAYRELLENGIRGISNTVVEVAAAIGCDLSEKVQQRWKNIEEKSIF